MKRKISFLVLFLVVVGLIFWSHSKKNSFPLSIALPLVTIVTAEPGQLAIGLDFPSVAESVQSVKLFPRVEGQLLKIHFTEGDIVTQGQLLFTLDSDIAQQQLAALQAQLKIHEARIAYYNKEQARYQQLSSKDYASQEQYDTSVMNSLTEAAAIDQVQAQINQVLLNIHYSKILSPINGTIGFVNVYEGTYIKMTDPLPLTTIVKLDPLCFPVFLPEKYLKFIQNNQATYTVKDQSGTLIADRLLNRAHLEAQDNTIDGSLGNIALKIAIDNPDGSWMPGMYATIRVTFEHKQGIKIPLICLQKGQKGDFVYLYKPQLQQVMVQPVTVTAMDEAFMIVSQGLRQGDQVVAQGQMRLRDHITVNAQPFKE